MNVLSRPRLIRFGIDQAMSSIRGEGFATRRPRSNLGSTVGVVFATMALSSITLSLVPTGVVTIIALIVTSSGFALWNVLVVSARQRATSQECLGPVGATYRSAVVAAAGGRNAGWRH